VSGRLVDINARIEGISKLSAVVNAMRGIAAARAQQARAQLAAVGSYSTTIRAAIGAVLPRTAGTLASTHGRQGRQAVVLFLAEQGFVGGFSERLLEAYGVHGLDGPLFLVGTRGTALARERAHAPIWHGAMPSHTAGIPRLADRIAEAVYAEVARGGFDTLDVMFSEAGSGGTVAIRRRRLIPFDTTGMAASGLAAEPVLNLLPDDLLARLSAEYVHAQLCDAALRAFAAENEARLQAMAATHAQIERTLEQLHSTQRIVRQDEITTEIIELAAGAAASRGKGGRAKGR